MLIFSHVLVTCPVNCQMFSNIFTTSCNMQLHLSWGKGWSLNLSKTTETVIPQRDDLASLGYPGSSEGEVRVWRTTEHPQVKAKSKYNWCEGKSLCFLILSLLPNSSTVGFYVIPPSLDLIVRFFRVSFSRTTNYFSFYSINLLAASTSSIWDCWGQLKNKVKQAKIQPPGYSRRLHHKLACLTSTKPSLQFPDSFIHSCPLKLGLIWGFLSQWFIKFNALRSKVMRKQARA